MTINLFLAFWAGVLSFVSPCTLPLYPAFLSYITGISADKIKSSFPFEKNAMLHTFCFLLGFSFVFLLFGFSASMIGRFFFPFAPYIRKAGALLLVFLGLLSLGVFRPAFLMKERRVSFRSRPAGRAGSFLIGMAFACGWTPCTGPILAAIIMLGYAHPHQGLLYMSVYILGFALPFFCFSFFIGKLNWVKKYSAVLMKIGGGVMAGMGISLYFDLLGKVSAFFSQYLFQGFTGF